MIASPTPWSVKPGHYLSYIYNAEGKPIFTMASQELADAVVQAVNAQAALGSTGERIARAIAPAAWLEFDRSDEGRHLSHGAARTLEESMEAAKRVLILGTTAPAAVNHAHAA